ncbi:hypothetical protein HJFPF1_00302 [Paramyrothecium foliicola]|nr:hypothetical protein HJFPF1_00302 [Paramyrothecium foliicola]
MAHLRDFTPVTDIDPNVWYMISEERVDKYANDGWSSSLQIRDYEKGEIVVFIKKEHYWQFQPVDAKKGRYSLRCSETGIFKQLSVCYHPDESSEGKTRPCLADSHGGDEQIWEVSDWGFANNATLRFTNVKNGTDYWMDVHPGNPMFMSSKIRTNEYQPAQRWLISSIKNVYDGDMSTIFTNLPTTATSEPATTTDVSTSFTSSTGDATITEPPSSTNSRVPSDNEQNTDNNGSSTSGGGTSVGLAAGVGVGVGVAVIALGLALFFWWRRRRRAAAQTVSPEMAQTPPYTEYSQSAPSWSAEQTAPQSYPHEYYNKVPQHPQELADTRSYAHELPTANITHELSGVERRPSQR